MVSEPKKQNKKNSWSEAGLVLVIMRQVVLKSAWVLPVCLQSAVPLYTMTATSGLNRFSKLGFSASLGPKVQYNLHAGIKGTVSQDYIFLKIK
jgi:hypothetical protein